MSNETPRMSEKTLFFYKTSHKIGNESDIDNFINDIILKKNREMKQTMIKSSTPDSMLDFILDETKETPNFNKKMLIFLEDNDIKLKNIIVYTPIRKTYFAFYSLFLKEDINHMICLSLNDLIKKVKKKFNVSNHYEIRIFNENLEVIREDKELFNEKEKILYAKCKTRTPNFQLNEVNKNKVAEKKDEKLIPKEAHTQNISFHTSLQNNLNKVIFSKKGNAFSNLKNSSQKKEGNPFSEEEKTPSIYNSAGINKFKLQHLYNHNNSSNSSIMNEPVLSTNIKSIPLQNKNYNLRNSKYTQFNSFKSSFFQSKFSTRVEGNKPCVINMLSVSKNDVRNPNETTHETNKKKLNQIERKKKILKMKLEITDQEVKSEKVDSYDNTFMEESEAMMSQSVTKDIELDDKRHSDIPGNKVSKGMKRISMNMNNKNHFKREENILLYLSVCTKLESFIQEKLNTILKDNNSSQLFSVGYYYFKEYKDFDISSYQNEFLFYVYLSEAVEVTAKEKRLQYKGKLFESVEFYEYLYKIDQIIDGVNDKTYELLSFVGSKELKSNLCIEGFLFRNLIFARKIYLKRADYLDILIKSLNIDDKINFDLFLEYKNTFFNPYLDYKKKFTYIKKVISIRNLDASPLNQAEFHRLFGIEERIYDIIKNMDCIEALNICKDKKSNIEGVFTKLLNYLIN